MTTETKIHSKVNKPNRQYRIWQHAATDARAASYEVDYRFVNNGELRGRLFILCSNLASVDDCHKAIEAHSN